MRHKRPESLSSQPHPTPSLPISQEESSHQKPNPPETWTCSIRELQESKFLCVCAQLRGPVGLFVTYGLLPARLLRLWDFSGKITEVGCHFLLQGIFLTLSSVQFSSVQSRSHVRLFDTPWTAASQASLTITNYWSLRKLLSSGSCPP